MYLYDEIDQKLVDERVVQFRDQTRRFLAGKLSDDEFRALRLRNGLYIQRYAPMLRIAIPYGLLSTKQLRKLAYIARKYDRGYGHFSTRQNLQLNWPKLPQAPDILAELATVQMHAIQTSGNSFRNITTDHFAGVAQDEIVDSFVWCEIIRQWSTFHPEFSYLPRKFKFAAIGPGTVHGELELAREIRELGMERGPLADDFAPDERVHDLVPRDAREMVGSDIAEGVAGGLDRVHLHGRQFREDVGHSLDLRPVQLQVLAGAEVAVAAVVLARDLREFSQLLRREQAVGNGDAQHRRVTLDVEAVPQAQRAELVLRELAGEKAPRLVAELDHTLVDELLVDFVVDVHGFYSASLPPMRISIAASAPRSTRSGIFWLSALPSQMPGNEPMRRAASSFQSTAPAAACPSPATKVS